LDADCDIAFLLTVFLAGPFRVGYLGFPAGGTLGESLQSSHAKALREARLPMDVLRVPVSAFGPRFETDRDPVATPETAVIDLSAWDLAALPKLRRDLNKARRAPVQVVDLGGEGDWAPIYHLYCDTVTKHGGNLRYTPAYFAGLLRLAARSPLLRCMGALAQGSLAGFVVVALNSGTGYYLHGATAAEWRSTGVSDLLVYTALEWAREQGMECFNLMASPPAQAGLVRYKEKFGGTTQLHYSYEFPLHPVRAGVFRIVSRAQGAYTRLCHGGA
jgi:hypothetical protein